MKATTFLILIFASLSSQAIGQECTFDSEIVGQITKDIDERDLHDTDASVEQLLLVNQAASEQLICLEELIANAVTELENTRAEQIENRTLIEDQVSVLDRLMVSLNQLTTKKDEIETGLNNLNAALDANRAYMEQQIVSLQIQQENTNAELEGNTNDLNERIHSSKEQTNEMIDSLEEQNKDTNANLEQLSIESSTSIALVNDYLRYLAIAICIVFVILASLFIYFGIYLQRRRASIQQKMLERFNEIETNILATDKNASDMLEKVTSSLASNKKDEEDHTLALKVADEIVRIEKNAAKMDSKTKGLKQLMASINRIQDNFAANGYEIVEMLDKPYDERMNVLATFVQDENLLPNEQVITKIIKPQINFKGQMIQTAQVEVSTGE
ncbi:MULTISPECIES: hypothetical protein [Gammaproteobacteria]|uniref:hypothetical protein n=1 Tax=Gammaproteobacteria TaxID=1236 RepID=UPI000DD00892|nr:MULTISPECIES: hypothetical protein [Gammaproteobacteria]RTE85516.1 hypothetical protein DQX04_11475 [Aliidiomarina sp. B3213]TCZ89486.1 hypothetical protein EYQ95_11405 [Lysobacter sp. N42]